MRDTVMSVVPDFLSGEVEYRTVRRRPPREDPPERSGSAAPHSLPVCRDMLAVRCASSSSRVLSVVSPDSRKCEEMREDMRVAIGRRMRTVEGSGMSQSEKSRRLMERVWETGLPSERLLTNEFIG